MIPEIEEMLMTVPVCSEGELEAALRRGKNAAEVK